MILDAVERAYLHWSLTEGVGPVLMTRLIERFGSAQAALAASAHKLEAIHGIGPRAASVIARARDAAAVDAELELAAAAGARIISRESPDFPAGLRPIPDAPLVLYVRGELRRQDALAVAVVGTRRCSRYGEEQARRFGEALASVGLCVVSGLARGVDAAAHLGALAVDGRTVAVVGCGLAEIYPPENKPLAEQIVAAGGAVVSELPMRASVRRENFPSRNRIIAGMSLGTLVVEAPLRSGALITARLASEYNREVFALPGRVNEPNAFGVNRLIREGAAKLVMSLEDVLEELGEAGRALSAATGSVAATAGQKSPAPDLFTPANGSPSGSGAALSAAVGASLTDVQKRVYATLASDEVLSDAIVEQTGLAVGHVLAALTELELKGLVRRLPGQRIRRTTVL